MTHNITFELLDYTIFGDDTDDIDDFINKQQAKNTVYGNNYAISTFNRYCRSILEIRLMENIPAPELNVVLCKFFMEIRKVNGNQFDPNSLITMHRGLQRYLDIKKVSFNILTDNNFEKSRKVLAAKRKQLVKEGFGNKPNATR